MKKTITTKTAILILAMAGLFSTKAFSQTAYITNNGSSTVSVINVTTNTVSATIPVGTNPYGVSVSSDGSKVYVTNSGAGTVSVINTATNSVTATISVGSIPYGVCVSPDNSKVYVVNFNSNTVSVINAATNTVSTTITVGANPNGVSVSPDGSKVYVTNYNSNTVSVISSATNSVSATIAVGSEPEGVSVTPDGSKVYVSNNGTNTVSVINSSTNTVMSTITVGNNPLGMAVSPDGSKVYVANEGANTVSIINTATNTVSSIITLSGASITIKGASLTPDGSELYVARTSEGDVIAINTTNFNTSLPITVGSGPIAFGNFISVSAAACIAPTALAVSNAYIDCHTGLVTLNGNGSSSGSNITYLWTTTNGHIVSGANTLTPVVDQVGIYVLTVTNTATTGCSSSATVTVNGIPAPIASFSATPISGTPPLTVNFTNNSSNATSYSWYFSGASVVAYNQQTPPPIVYNSIGTYTVYLTVNNSSGCSSTDSSVVIIVTSPLGITNIKNNKEITISPNPFTSQTTISFSEIQKNTTIKIMDMVGKEIKNAELILKNEKSVNLDMSGYAKGVYLVQITDANKNDVNRRIIVNC